MSIFISSIQWSWLLSIALLIPISLPAGGAQKSLIEPIKTVKTNQLMSGECCDLRVSPSMNSSVLIQVPLGITMQSLRFWKNDAGNNWMQVKISSLPLLDKIGVPTRGWVNFDRFD